MSESLAQSLVEAAAEAVYDAPCLNESVTGDWHKPTMTTALAMSRVALVALLEKLAEEQDAYVGTVLGALASVPEMMDTPAAKALPGVLVGRHEVADHLRRLAEAIREDYQTSGTEEEAR